MITRHLGVINPSQADKGGIQSEMTMLVRSEGKHIVGVWHFVVPKTMKPDLLHIYSQTDFLAQMVEHLCDKQSVAGSNPVKIAISNSQ